MTGYDPDIPTGPELTDPLLAELRAARPEPPPEVLSPRTAPNRALVEEIIMTATSASADDTDARPPIPTPRRRTSRRRLGVLAGAAAIAVALVAAAIVAPWSTEESAADADALVRASAVATRAALADTGRATKTTEIFPGNGERVGPEVLEFEFAGDDERYMYPAPDGIYDNRIVDGYNYILNFDSRHPDRWYRVLCNAGIERETPDPRTLVEALTADADFEIVGEEDVDGVRTTHLRARNPGAIPAATIGGLMPSSTVTAFDVWVDGDDVARRFDATVETEFEEVLGPPIPDIPGSEDIPNDTGPWVTEWSLEFWDLGEDINIAAPTEYEDVTNCDDS